jgi:D-alanyl-D-alanine carboxypeptidase
VLWLSLSLCLTFFTPTQATVQAASTPDITATSAIAVDVNSGRILYSKNMHRRLAQASTTKIMTALTAFWIEGTRLDETYTVVKEDLVGEASMGLRAGEVVTFQDLLYGMLLNSGNDAAMAIAHYAGAKLPGPADPVARFVARMNQNARSLGMRNSNYANPHGLDQDNHYSSAYDLAISGWYILKSPTLSQIIATKSANRAGKPLSNLNKLLTRYAGATGIKPGYTDNAKYCLVGSATRNGQTVISVIMGDSAQGYLTNPDRLLDYAFNQLKDPEIQKTLQQGATIATAEDYLGRPEGDHLMSLNGPNVSGAAVGVNVVNIPANGGIINAQVNQIDLTPTTTQLTPTTTIGSNSQSDTSSSSSTKKEGGFNFFGLLLLILIAVGIFYGIIRFTPLGGERGLTIAYHMEDYAMKAWRALRWFILKIWSFVRPVPSEEPPFRAAPHQSQRSSNPSMSRPAVDSNRVSRPTGTFDAANPESQPENHQPVISSRPNPTRPLNYSPDVNEPDSNAHIPGQTGKARERNPLENFFDDIDPFTPETLGSASNPAMPIGSPIPPSPIPPRPIPNYPPRTAAEPQPKPDDVTSGQRQAPPNYRPPATPPPIAGGGEGPGSRPHPAFSPETEKQSTPTPSNYSRPTESLRTRTSSVGNTGSDSLAIRARQAIDYAYAGRIVASTEEFRRVVEQEPMFDFGSIEEFEQMPVLGYKALATAYHDINKIKVAVLLLEMAIEHYPNNLELRNMLRSLRREMEQ